MPTESAKLGGLALLTIFVHVAIVSFSHCPACVACPPCTDSRAAATAESISPAAAQGSSSGQLNDAPAGAGSTSADTPQNPSAPSKAVASPSPSFGASPDELNEKSVRKITEQEATVLGEAAAKTKLLPLPLNEPVQLRNFTADPGALGTNWWLYRDAREFADLAEAGTDKANVHQYQLLYSRVLRPYREHASWAPARKALFPTLSVDQPIPANWRGAGVPPQLQPFKMLEIGLGCTMGGSWGPAGGFHLFRRFLPNVRYFSFEYDFRLCEKKWKKTKSALTTKRHMAYLTRNHVDGDQNKIEDLNRAIDKFGFVDIIVDDGSHCMDHQKRTFRHLFLNMLRPGGVYIVEDLSANFAVFRNWQIFCASTARHRRRETMVQYVHDLITTMSFITRDDPVRWNSAIDWGGPDVEVSRWVQQVVCDREVCAITKKTHPYDRFGAAKLVPRFDNVSAAAATAAMPPEVGGGEDSDAAPSPGGEGAPDAPKAATAGA